ncbi:hypothetical protein MPTK1_5g19280 [Marchantia polymorpha subsp. ruderalis]|uniref:Uncharacterized protein n=2 Tax=Marchantia polymorpha TaxID=3197 RepID=A0AAF6BK07_MARPO|nr:hypothetical protein MARPO_0073s0016 [Marchantia polymorpha]BBN12341.1 hypothetical protein Mp_5g19280 [Marchantia polymorpha subsp. ruderalis]|eukprot:PTQ35136.1 hypothetical protein MARPO_0073s0016 [Marchantia polymorpha]
MGGPVPSILSSFTRVEVDDRLHERSSSGDESQAHWTETEVSPLKWLEKPQVYASESKKWIGLQEWTMKLSILKASYLSNQSTKTLMMECSSLVKKLHALHLVNPRQY